MARLRKIILWLLLMAAFGTGTLYLLLYFTPESPAEGLERARAAISEARKANAHQYALTDFKKAEGLYQTAIKKWMAENEKFILRRNYREVDSLVEVIIALAGEASGNARSNSESTEKAVKNRLKSLENLARQYDRQFNEIPVPKSVRKKFALGKLLLEEARKLYGQKQYLAARDKAEAAAVSINESTKVLKSLLNDYFRDYPQWREWYHKTVRQSVTEKNHVIIVDKFARKCYIYKNGKLKDTYPVELGKNWLGDKKYRGDKSTPEGIYRVTKKLDQKKTKYYKALLINYPNDEDKERFQEAKRNGTLPRNAHIGGLIEIHGDGGKGADWTDGCVALKNEDMDHVYRIAGINTTVTIVGSLRSLSEILK